ncbi:uncharacterized protein LOC132720622 [Ruditapes philippinarum]|uniref:uncharacterized protein LOC132720622 n=1 Tax=Ruditapes philippinarum TaxID=129788 RepID=UPI00295BFD50|nr:uncharacterized protein LOC132720622 [Ruditapes philippinarum]
MLACYSDIVSFVGLLFICFLFIMAEAAVRAASDKDDSFIDTEKSDKSSTSVKSVNSKSNTKPRPSSSGSKCSVKDLDKRVSDMERKFDSGFEKLFQSLEALKSTSQYTEGSALLRTVDNMGQHTVGSAQLGAVDEGSSTLAHRPRRCMNINDDAVTDDILSLHPRDQERLDSFGLCDDVASIHSSISDSSAPRNDAFQGYLNPETPIMLQELFGSDSSQHDGASSGLILDDLQVSILNKSWRAQNPERISAYKEEYKSCFPVHEKSVEFLGVPGLDELLEPMLQKRHGAKMTKAWGKSRQLCTQPLKSIETLNYQGQLASRLNIIAISYIQKSLGSLLSTLKEKEPNMDKAVQTVRDIFEMSSKALDQAGRSGAFHHLSRRKAAVSDSGLNTLKDIQSKVMYLPLTADGVFGSGLQSKLKNRKEQKDQLTDLVPEFFERQKRKPETSYERSNFKKAKVQHNTGGQRQSFPYNVSNSRTFPLSGNKENRQKDFKSQSVKPRSTGAIPTFRIPKKQ